MKEDFDGTIEFMQFACLRLKLKDGLTSSLLNCLRDNRDKLCISAEQMLDESQGSFNISPQQQESFQNLLNRFFQMLERQENPALNTEEMKNDYVYRITNILHGRAGQEVQYDREMADNMPVNSTQPIFLAAEIFYETMFEMGFAEEDA